MASRMDRYRYENGEDTYSRTNRNQELYKNIGSNTRYANITDVTNTNAYEIDTPKGEVHTRESYKQLRALSNNENIPKEKQALNDFNYLYNGLDNKVYDINQVLEEARKNRTSDDNKEEKRRLKNTSYNIVASLNPEELEKYRKEKLKRVQRASDEDDKETSVNLLTDLMATAALEKVEAEEDDTHASTILNEEDIEKIKELEEQSKLKEEDLENTTDSEFYTRSMDLSDQDFETEEEFVDKKMPLAIKILLGVIIVAAICAVGYYIYKNFS